MTSESTPPTLLSLPGELRNRIYRHALVSDLLIRVTRTKDWEQPALLATSKQIRHEARKIYYLENRFRLIAANMDSAAITAFAQNVGPYLHDDLQIVVEPTGRPDWNNLLRWLKDFFEGRSIPDSESPEAGSPMKVVTNAFDIVRELAKAGLAWEQVVPVLESYRNGVDGAGHTWRWQ
ncbi:hypothetical protein LTR85_008910 [Meristemomyces frigidus]|nr:hypothetical protein LTR85_008910 [Meristemomyces frigidus]